MSYIFELLDAKTNVLHMSQVDLSDQETGTTSLLHMTTKQALLHYGNNAKVIARKNIGRFNSGLATNYAVVVGAKTSRSSLFPWTYCMPASIW